MLKRARTVRYSGFCFYLPHVAVHCMRSRMQDDKKTTGENIRQWFLN